VSRFFQNASEIFEAASAAPSGSEALTILIRPSGQLHIVDGGDSPLDALRAEHGCRTAFRVSRDGQRVRVEGRDGATRCTLESAQKPVNTLGLFRDFPAYEITAPAARLLAA
jgi:hypothetical protein